MYLQGGCQHALGFGQHLRDTQGSVLQELPAQRGELNERVLSPQRAIMPVYPEGLTSTSQVAS